MNPIFSVYKHLGSRRRMQLLLVMLLMLAGALAEVFTLGAVVPFLGLLVNPDVLDKYTFASSILNAVAQEFGGNRLLAASILFAALAVSAAILRLLLSWVSHRFVFAVGADFGEAIYSRTLQQPYEYHLRRNSSETLAAIDKVGWVVMGVMMPCMELVIAFVMVGALFGALVWVNAEVALLAVFIFVGLYTIISLLAKKWVSTNGQLISDNATLKIKAMQEGLGAIRDVIIDGNHSIYVKQFAHADRAQRQAQAINLIIASSPKYVVESVGMVLIVILAYWLTKSPGGVSVAIPTLGALALGAQRMLPYAQNIYNSFSSILGGMAATKECLALLDLPLSEKYLIEKSGGVSVQDDALRTVELSNVSFEYAPGAQVVLSSVNLSIHVGQRVGFIGATGSGKSTLIDLIMGLLHPVSGEILINGLRLTTNNLRQWQSRIAHVPQSIFLIDSSIAENIALGVSIHEIDQKRLHLALEQAQLTDFVKQLPEGVKTKVGERGVQLSGGQRQRIGIARALYKDASVLVLDEATSALDNDTESKVMHAIYELRPNMMVLMIAHRISSLAQCEVVYEIRNGEAFQYRHI